MRQVADLCISPVLYRFFHLLTPPKELPALPQQLTSYRGIHAYTAAQIIITIGIFIVTLTKGAPMFPILIVVLVPVRLLLMSRIWNRETLRFVDKWACKNGTPEDDMDLLINEKGPTSNEALALPP